MSPHPIEAYGINNIVASEAIDGLVVVTTTMRGGETVRFALHPRTSAELRLKLLPAEQEAASQRLEMGLPANYPFPLPVRDIQR